MNDLIKQRFQEIFQVLEGMESTLLASQLNSRQLHIRIAKLHKIIEQLMEITFLEKDSSLKPFYAMLELRARNLMENLEKKMGNCN